MEPDTSNSYSKILTLSCARHQGHGRAARAKPELLLNNFDTRLEHRLGRMLASLSYQDPNILTCTVIWLSCSAPGAWEGGQSKAGAGAGQL